MRNIYRRFLNFVNSRHGGEITYKEYSNFINNKNTNIDENVKLPPKTFIVVGLNNNKLDFHDELQLKENKEGPNSFKNRS